MAYPGLSLEGRAAVVMGGSSGIGELIAVGLAQAGADVAASSRRESEVERTADAIEGFGRRALRKTADMTRRTSLEGLLAAALAEFGKVDILINCEAKLATSSDAAAQNDVLESNVAGAFQSCQVFGRHMLERGYGRIVNVASFASLLEFIEGKPYTEESALIGLTRSLAAQWGGDGVLVNAVVPGVFHTPRNESLRETALGREVLRRTPLERFGTLEELVAPVLFLASEGASFVNGQVLTVDGGLGARPPEP